MRSSHEPQRTCAEPDTEAVKALVTDVFPIPALPRIRAIRPSPSPAWVTRAPKRRSIPSRSSSSTSLGNTSYAFYGGFHRRRAFPPPGVGKNCTDALIYQGRIRCSNGWGASRC